MNKIIRKLIYPVVKKVLSALNSPLWLACNVFVGYVVAIALAVVFLVYWPFNQYAFAISLIWGISFLRLIFGNIRMNRMSIIIMWSIFFFGLFGIVLQVLNIDGCLLPGIVACGFCAIYSYSYIPVWSAFLKYKKPDFGYDLDGNKTKYNGKITSMFIFVVTMFIASVNMVEFNEERENQKLLQQFQTESFEPVKMLREEIYDGHTVYILEAKGAVFAVNPFEYPEVRKINKDSQVKVVLGGVDDHHLRTVKKIQFKN